VGVGVTSSLMPCSPTLSLELGSSVVPGKSVMFLFKDTDSPLRTESGPEQGTGKPIYSWTNVAQPEPPAALFLATVAGHCSPD
jgi:hypothetical protein